MECAAKSNDPKVIAAMGKAAMGDKWFQPKSINDLSIGEMYFAVFSSDKHKTMVLGEFEGEYIFSGPMTIDLTETIPEDLWCMLFQWPEFVIP